MKTLPLMALGCLGLLLLSGCGGYFIAPVQPPVGGLFTSYKAPLSGDFDETQVYQKKGSASTSFFHDPILTGLSFAWDDSMVAEAARNGNIETVGYADYEFFNILGIYSRFTIHAYGE